jgi:hypothetical protein
MAHNKIEIDNATEKIIEFISKDTGWLAIDIIHNSVQDFYRKKYPDLIHPDWNAFHPMKRLGKDGITYFDKP